jgi:hypothetical protein
MDQTLANSNATKPDPSLNAETTSMITPVPNAEGNRVRGAASRARRGEPRSAGQIIVILAMSIFVLMGMVALVVDVSWYWVNSLRVQRTADAAALAGVVYLPGSPSDAFAVAKLEASKNGYTDLVSSVSITTVQDPPGNGRRLNVTVSAPLNTFFMRIFGINQIPIVRTGKAEFVLPVPMGSPENYYGVFGLTRGLTTTGTVVTTNHTWPPGTSANSGFLLPTTSVGPPTWTVSGAGTLVNAVRTNDTIYAQTSTNLAQQQWGNFNLLGGLAGNQNVKTVNGLEVRLTDAYLSAACANSKIQVFVSWDAGVTWSTTVTQTGNLGTGATPGALPVLGANNSMAAWANAGHPTWVQSDLADANFRVKVQANKGGACAGVNVRLDLIEVRATYTIDTVTTTSSVVTNPIVDQNLKGPGTACPGVGACYQADGSVLNPRGFWATMNTEGAANVNGDAFQPYYDTVGGATNPAYDATTYYNYAVEMPAGTTNGSVYVYDPVFCATAVNKGTADRWFSGSGSSVSSFFELYDTKGTLYDMTDDGAPVATSGGLFRNVSASDDTMGGPATGGSITQCRTNTDGPYGDGRDYHDNWYLLASGLTGGANGHIYRIHTTSTDPANAAAQRGTDGENSYALFGSATGGTPKIYGLGAMQMFTPLSAAGSAVQSEFYLAQIDAVHAGKTVELQLWDPGDTNPLSASVEVLVPNAVSWSPATFDWVAAKGTTNANAANCDVLAGGTNVTSVQTNVGATNGTFNGCWLTLEIPIPSGYVADQSGWWKIRYTMNGTGTSNDVTTWTVRIKGNPVHLIVP